MATAWPPAADASTVWRDRTQVRLDGVRTEVRTRWVSLWARLVQITDDGEHVVCPGCKELVPIAELGDRESRHLVAWPQLPGGMRDLPRELDLCDDRESRRRGPSW